MPENRTIYNFSSGDVFNDRYMLQSLIGTGGYADVWSATDRFSQCTVALKIYTRVDEEGYRDLVREYNSVHDLSHTNILRAEHIDKWGNVPYLEMKLCKGGSLEGRAGKNEGASTALNIIRDISSGLAYLHTNNIVHQDVKAANILVDYMADGTEYYMLCDFGISDRTRRTLNATYDPGVSMTALFAPPEKFSPRAADRKADPKGDIFSLGITMYEFCTGHLPYDNIPTGRVLRNDQSAAIDFSEISDPGVRMIIERCLQADPANRPTAYSLVTIASYMLASPGHPLRSDCYRWNETCDARESSRTTPSMPVIPEASLPADMASFDQPVHQSSIPRFVAVALVFAVLAFGIVTFISRKNRPAAEIAPQTAETADSVDYSHNGIDDSGVATHPVAGAQSKGLPGSRALVGTAIQSIMDLDAEKKPMQPLKPLTSRRHGKRRSR